MPGVKNVQSWIPDEIRFRLNAPFLSIPITVETGQNLAIGTVVGERPTSGKFIAYDKDAAASATSASADGDNTGNGSCSSVSVQDSYTKTEFWTLTASDADTFAVVGSVSGSVGNATVGVEFKYPNSASYIVKFTLIAGMTPFVAGDIFTFSTTAAGARTADGILTAKTDASDEDITTNMYAQGSFVKSKLTGLDDQAVEDMNGKVIGDELIM